MKLHKNTETILKAMRDAGMSFEEGSSAICEALAFGLNKQAICKRCAKLSLEEVASVIAASLETEDDCGLFPVIN